MRRVHSVGAVDNELTRCELLDVVRDLGGPRNWHVHVPEDWPAQFIASLVCIDCWILGIRETRVWIYVSKQVLDVILEISYDSAVGVELLD